MITMSEQKNPKMFRTVLGGGYQKSDVNAYIETMQAQFQSVESTLKNTINHQSAELDTLRRQLDEAQSAKETAEQLQSALDGAAEKLGQVCEELESCKITCISAEAARTTAEASLAAAREEIAATKEELAAAKEEIAAAKEKFAGLTAERDAAKAELSELRAQYEALLSEQKTADETVPAENTAEVPQTVLTQTVVPDDYESLKLKAEQYDRMSAHIGAVMLKANAGAEEVMKRAQADADAMVDEVNRTLTETRERAQASADHLIDDISRSLAEISRGCREEIVLDLDELRVALRTLESTVESKYADINRKLDYTKEEMEQTAGAIIRSATAPVVLKTDA